MTGEDVKEAKPSPEIYLKAAEIFDGVSPQNILVIEDALAGIVAAQRAGMNTVFLSTSSDARESGANLIIKSFKEFDFSLFKFIV